MRLEKNELEEEREKLSGHLGMLTAEKKKNQTLRDALKQEAEFIMTDLEETNRKIRDIAQERDDAKKLLGVAMNELSKRNTKFGQSEEQITKLKKTITHLDEQISFMDIQV
jgi:chromosome segregation ATPase